MEKYVVKKLVIEKNYIGNGLLLVANDNPDLYLCGDNPAINDIVLCCSSHPLLKDRIGQVVDEYVGSSGLMPARWIVDFDGVEDIWEKFACAKIVGKVSENATWVKVGDIISQEDTDVQATVCLNNNTGTSTLLHTKVLIKNQSCGYFH